MPTIVWVVIGIIFIIVWGTIIIVVYNTPTISDNDSLEEDKINKPLTREFLLDRGFCCDNGCKNCPY
tara:strand:- start:229 stop:429 length:201 start_codon:yes stop_codon:yes gene_type:complete